MVAAVHGPHFDVLIVGSGHGGAQTAISLRQGDFTGSIGIVSAEDELPYERPPLSKEYFSGEKSEDRLRIRPASFWSEKTISLLLGEKVTDVDPDEHAISTRSGRTLSYGILVWAAGGSPRQLPLQKSGAPNVLSIRTLDDANRLRALADGAERVLVVGGGYIGLEAASVLVKAGKKVTLVEALDRLLSRAAGTELARHIENVHREYGVELRFGVGIGALEGHQVVSEVRFTDGERIECDLVIVGIGIVPEVEPLARAGARCDNGVVVDEYCRTSLPDIYAIGDCAAYRNVYANGALIRLESVQNAVDMAKAVAESLLGRGRPYLAVPWFWSHQSDMRIQTIGLSVGHDATVVRGDMSTGSFSVIYLREGVVVALDCVNAVRDYVQGRALVVAGAKVARERLADPAVALKDA